MVGETLDLPAGDGPDPQELVEALAGLGWSQARIAEHAIAVTAAGGVWPHPVEAQWRQGLGAARFLAVLRELREKLGVAELDVRLPSTRTDLTRDEQRLLAEVPPHHGPVG